MGNARVHTLYRRGGWLVELEDGGVLAQDLDHDEALALGASKAESLSADHVIHAKDGLVLEERRHADWAQVDSGR